MKTNHPNKNPEAESTHEYSVEFACVSTFIVGFKDAEGLTEKQILQRAIQLADSSFEKGGSLSVERQNPDGYYVFSAIGIDRSNAQVIGEKLRKTPLLKLIRLLS